MHSGFIFTSKNKQGAHSGDELEFRLKALKDKITGLKRSIEYI